MSLEHPNVVPIYDAGDVDGRVYLAMRLVDGTDLGTLLRAEGALEPARALAICAQIASALDAAHARGLVHRDVKPSNVLLDGTEHVYLADFGLTRRLDDQEAPQRARIARSARPPTSRPSSSRAGRSTAAPTSTRSAACCTSASPASAVFPRDSRLAVAWAHLEDEPPQGEPTRPELPEAIDAVVSRALAKEPGGALSDVRGAGRRAGQALGFGRCGPPSDGERCSSPPRPRWQSWPAPQ